MLKSSEQLSAYRFPMLIRWLGSAFGLLSIVSLYRHWLFFFCTIVISWLGIFSTIIPIEQWQDLGLYGWDLLFALCSMSPSNSDFLSLVSMWVLMSVAMMLPTLVPALRCYDELISTGACSRIGFGGVTAGFLAVWLIFSLLAASLQHLGHLVWSQQFSDGEATKWLLVSLLFCAGLYQFSALKMACLIRCQNPLVMFLSHWREERSREIEIGVRLGLTCLGCCWLLMSLAWVGSVMSLAWMGLFTLVMAVEKLPESGRYISYPFGAILIIAAMTAAIS